MKKLYIRTFGCQMNEYDSDKMADVLGAHEELVKTDNPEDADVILFNTCSVREKAQERVFHDLGRVRLVDLPEQLPGVAALLDDGRWTRAAEQELLAPAAGRGSRG